MSRARGFTLLEVMLATVLMAVLMTGIWGLLSTYQRLFSAGERATEQSQLARTLLEQISDDLLSAIPDSATGLPGASTSVRRFGLFGTERALQVDVLQITPAQGVAVSTARDPGTVRNMVADGARPAASPALAMRVPELHTVQYWFEEPFDEGGEGASAMWGMVRRELDWETPPRGYEGLGIRDAGFVKRGSSGESQGESLIPTPNTQHPIPCPRRSLRWRRTPRARPSFGPRR
jgi:prepilin-type N-terminal cleavage/methylation domain-containing protein